MAWIRRSLSSGRRGRRGPALVPAVYLTVRTDNNGVWLCNESWKREMQADLGLVRFVFSNTSYIMNAGNEMSKL